MSDETKRALLSIFSEAAAKQHRYKGTFVSGATYGFNNGIFKAIEIIENIPATDPTGEKTKQTLLNDLKSLIIS